MKKLALALLCLFSVAFFASCNKTIDHPEPSIAVKTGDNYLMDGATINFENQYKLGIRCESNTQTKKELANFRLQAKIFSVEGLEVASYDSTWLVSGTEYTYEESWSIIPPRELVARVVITATITDVAGKYNSAVLHLNLDVPTQALVSSPITWVKTGHNVQDLSAYGLVWKENNYKSPFTHIVPAEGSVLYLVENGDAAFAGLTTDLDLLRYFADLTESVDPIDDYKNIDCNASANYHDLLICMDGNDDLHAILISRADIETGSFGTRITITGNAKE